MRAIFFAIPLLLSSAFLFAADSGAFSLSPATVRVTEAMGATAEFSIRRSGDLSTPATVDVFTENDGAVADLDYVAVSNTLSFAAGVGTNTVSIPILDNGYAVSGTQSRDFFVRLRNPSEGLTLGRPANGTVFIADDDPATWACRGVYLVPPGGAWPSDSDSRSPYYDADEQGFLFDIFDDSLVVSTWEDVDAEDVLTPATEFLFLEAGSLGADSLRNFLAANRSRLETWVAAGGHLLVNVTDPSRSLRLPFGAATTPCAVSTATAANAAHAVYTYPYRVPSSWFALDDPADSVADSALVLDSATAPFQSIALDAASGAPIIASAFVGCGSVTLSTLRPARDFHYTNSRGKTVSAFEPWENLLYFASDLSDPLFVTQAPTWEINGYAGDLSSFFPTGKVYSIENYGDSPLHVSVSCDADWLGLSFNEVTVPGMSYADLTVSLSPLVRYFTEDTYTATLTFTNLDTGRVLLRDIRLVVNPIPGRLAPVSDSIAPEDDALLPFGDCILGTYSYATFALRNLDPDHGVRILDIAFTGTPGFYLYGLGDLPFTVPAGSSSTFTVEFAPETLGNASATLLFATDDPDNAILQVAVSGTGVIDTLDLTCPEMLSFSAHPGGAFTPESETCILSNRAPATATWRLRGVPEWLTATPASGSLAGGNSLTLSLTPSASANTLDEGSYTASLLLTNLTTHVVQTISVTLSIVTTPALSLSPASLAFTNLVGHSSTQSLALANLPSADGPLTYSLFVHSKPSQPNFATLQLCNSATSSAPLREGGAPEGQGEPAETPATSATSATPATSATSATSSLLVRFSPHASKSSILASAASGATLQRSLRTSPDTSVVHLPDGADARAIASTLASMPGVEAVQPNYRYHSLATPNDPSFHEQWGLCSSYSPAYDIHATAAWDIAHDASSVVVAVIDTGVDLDHPDLLANLWTNPGEIPGNGIDDDGNGYIDDVYGYDFINGDPYPDDDRGHGTHCAGIIGAVGDNSIGVCGVCWKTQIMSLKFLDSSGYGTTADAIDAIRYAVRNGAKVISASWGGEAEADDAFLREAIEEAGAAGVLFVCAAGNDGADLEKVAFSPAGFECDNLVTVINMTYKGARSTSSNYGAVHAHIAAPGGGIYSTYSKGRYESLSGTSMACPHVAGAAALLLAQHPDLTPQEVKTMLLATAQPLPSLSGKCATGGCLDLYALLCEDPSCDWLEVDLASGSLSPGETASIPVTANASGLAPGFYSAILVVYSNDAAAPATSVPVSLTVLPDPSTLILLQ